MDNKILIFGTTELGDNLYYLLNSEGERIDGFCVNKQYYDQYSHLGQPVYAFEDLRDLFPSSQIEFYVCIGYKNMNSRRRSTFSMIKSHGYSIRNYVHSSAKIYAEQVGEGNILFENAYIGMYSQIGDGNIFYPNSLIAHHAIVGDFNFFSVSSSIAGRVRIGNENFFGNNSTTKDTITIGNSILVGAGAYVASSPKDNSVIVPGRSIILPDKNSRDIL